MKIIIIAFWLTLITTFPLLSADFGLNVEKLVLENGLIVLTAEDPAVPTVSVQTFINAGSRDEDRPGITGLAHVFEHMMFRGTEAVPEYSDAVAPLGAQKNAYTTADYTCYFVNVKAPFLERVLEIESDRIRNLDFTREKFRTELGPVKEERRRDLVDDPGGFLEVELFKEAYNKHTYQHPVIGWEEDLEVNMTFEDGLQFKNRFYVPNNCILVIAGNFNTVEARELVRKYYGDWVQGEPYTPNIEEEPKQAEERIKNFAWKDNQVSPLIKIGYHAYSVKTDFEGLAALNLINKILFSRSGRLTRLLKNELSLVESIKGEARIHKDPTLEVIHARLKRDVSLDQVRDLVYSQLELLKTTPVPEAELNRAVNNLRAAMIYRLDRPARIAGSVGYFHLISGDYMTMIQLYEMYDKITTEKIMAVATEVFDKFNRTVVTLSPKSST